MSQKSSLTQDAKSVSQVLMSDTLIAEKRSEALEQLKTQMSALGFSAEDITGRKQRRKRRKYKDDEGDDPPA